MLKQTFFVLAVFISQVSLGANLPLTEPSRIVDVERLAGPAKQLIFSMAYATLPLCERSRNSWNWTFGPSPKLILEPKSTGLSSLFRNAEAQTLAIAQHFEIAAGAAIFLSDTGKTPWDYGGFRPYEPFEFQSKGLDFVNLLYSIKSKDPAKVEANDVEIRANPVVKFEVVKKGERVSLSVRRVATCTIFPEIVDSKYLYADSTDRTIYLTVPLLEKLSHDELIAVIAHEVAHVATEMSVGRARQENLAELFLGKLVALGQNPETGLREPNASDLVKADRLAMRLAAAFGVPVPAYVEVLRKLTEDKDLLGRPTYRLTRGIPLARDEQLKRSVELWNDKQRFYNAQGIELPILQQIFRRARNVNLESESIFSPVLKELSQGVEQKTDPATLAPAE